MIHKLDETGEEIHVDIDPFIPTGICAICTGVEQDTLPPEDRPGARKPAKKPGKKGP